MEREQANGWGEQDGQVSLKAVAGNIIVHLLSRCTATAACLSRKGKVKKSGRRAAELKGGSRRHGSRATSNWAMRT